MSTITIIGHILTFSSMIWTVLFFIKSRSREYISHEIKHGHICYRCKNKIKEPDYWSGNFEEGKPELCVACKRDDALRVVVSGHRYLLSYFRKIDFTDKKWSNYFTYLSIIAVLFNVCNLFFSGLNIVGGACLFLAQFMFYRRFMAITRKKETQSN